MDLFTAFLYGAVQGLTEYLPVSSSAHLILLPRFLGIAEPGLTFDVFLHAGTLAATLIYFRREWLGLLGRKTGQAGPAKGPGWIEIGLACLPVLLVGAVFRQWIGEELRGTRTVAWGMIVGGVLLYLADRFAPRGRPVREIVRGDAIGVGLFQCLALWPGMSRSGSTILGGRFLGLSREAAARFSFLVSAPVTGAALAFELRHGAELVAGLGSDGILVLLTGGLSAFVFGWIAIDGLIRMVSRVSLGWFSLYRLLLGGWLLLSL